MKENPVTARHVAIEVLHRVAERGAYASAALDAELRRAALSPADAGLATEIVYGTLRALPELDARIDARLRHGGKVDPLARAALRTGCYQLMHLSRVPPHAVVDETVRVVRGARGARLGGFVNAILRALARERPAQPEPPAHVSVQDWVRASLEASLGVERTAMLLDRRPTPPPLSLRVRDAVDIERVAADIAEARPHAEIARGSVAPRALLLRRAGDPRELPGYLAGAFAVQEEGAQALALALGAQPGESVADLCAGHGGKTALLAERVGESGRVLAVDLDDRKLQRIGQEFARLELSAAPLTTAAVDLGVGIGEIAGGFDRVLVDAPCSGLGTLHRRPELLLRLSPDDPRRLGELQGRILTNAAQLVRPGGILAYAVCSPTREECADVAAGFEAKHPDFVRSRGAWPEPIARLASDSDGILRVGPWMGAPEWGSPDAYQLVCWKRQAGG